MSVAGCIWIQAGYVQVSLLKPRRHLEARLKHIVHNARIFVTGVKRLDVDNIKLGDQNRM